jgi:potassium efflux system protein
LFWTLETIRQTCRRNGLGEQHFGWNAENLRRVHHSMVGLMTCALPATFLVTVAEAMQDGVCRVSLARLIFLTALFVIAGLLHFVLKPTGGVVHKILENRTTRWLSPLRYGAYALGVGTPLVLAGLSACGYSFTAKQLLNRRRPCCCTRCSREAWT